MTVTESASHYIIKLSKKRNLIVSKGIQDIDKEIIRHKAQLGALNGMVMSHEQDINAFQELKEYLIKHPRKDT